MSLRSFRLRARWILPVSSAPLENGEIEVEAGRIVGLRPASSARSALDWGDVVVLPAGVNAHTHLELSDCENRLGTPGMAFPDWIAKVVAWRRQRAASRDQPETTAVRRGIQESIQHGVTRLGDITTTHAAVAARHAGMGGVSFLELLGLGPAQGEEQVRRAEAFVSAVKQRRQDGYGISPHAPYTISLACLRELTRLASVAGWPVAMHLAESAEELELLSTQRGPLVDLLESWQAWYPEVMAAGSTPVEYLRVLATAPRSLVIHGNFLTAGEIATIAEYRDRMSVVYCPRTHQFFGHPPHPLESLLQQHIVVALGTDSRASTPDLSILAEMRAVAARHPAVKPSEIVKMGTANAAWALGLGADSGTLQIGQVADLLVLESAGDRKDPYETVLGPEPRIRQVVVRGEPQLA